MHPNSTNCLRAIGNRHSMDRHFKGKVLFNENYHKKDKKVPLKDSRIKKRDKNCPNEKSPIEKSKIEKT